VVSIKRICRSFLFFVFWIIFWTHWDWLFNINFATSFKYH